MPLDEERIRYAIDQAHAEDRPIDDGVARAIAAQLHGPDSPAMTALSTTGAIQYSYLAAEILKDVHDDSLDAEVKGWLVELALYRMTVGHDRPAVPGWHMLWADDPPEAEQESPQEVEPSSEHALLVRIPVTVLDPFYNDADNLQDSVAIYLQTIIHQAEERERVDIESEGSYQLSTDLTVWTEENFAADLRELEGGDEQG